MVYDQYPDWEEINQELVPESTVPMLDSETPTFMRRPYAYSKSDLQDADVAIIGAPYVQNDTGTYYGVDVEDWVAGPKRVRQQSAKYGSGWMSAFGFNVFDHLNVVDYGDADIPDDITENPPPNAEQVISAQKAVEKKVNDALEAGATPLVLGQNSPAGSYAISKPVLERTDGNVGMVKLDTHLDANAIDGLTKDERVAGGDAWVTKMYEWHDNARYEDLVDIGVRGYGDVIDDRSLLDEYNFYPMYELKDVGVQHICDELRHAYDNTESTYLHFDMDVMGGGGSAPGDLLGGLAEPMGMSEYEVLKLSEEIGKRGFDAASFICLMPGSQVMYRTFVYVLMYLLAGKVLGNNKNK
jgi:agmatinase